MGERTFLRGDWRLCARLVAAIVLVVAPARAGEDHDGVSVDLSVGLGVTQTSSFAGGYNGSSFTSFETNDVEFAVLLPALSVGVWAAPKLGLGWRITNFWYVPNDGELVNGYFGAEVLVLPIPEAFFAWGLGVQLLGETFDGADAGIGMDVRGALTPLERDGHRFGIFAELIPGFVGGDFTYSAGGGFLWFVP